MTQATPKPADTPKTTPKTTPKSTPAKATSPNGQDAIALLKADHEAVTQLFDEYEKTRSAPNKKALVADICTALSVHAQIEEEVFYPAFQAALKDKLLVPEATVEHAGVKDLIAQLQASEPEDPLYDARVKVLSEYVKHHVKEEQGEMFPKAKASSLDLNDLGTRMAARKTELLAHPKAPAATGTAAAVATPTATPSSPTKGPAR